MKVSAAPILVKPKFSHSEGSKIYSGLREKVTAAGILGRSYYYYLFSTLVTILGTAVSVHGALVSSSILEVALWSIAFVFFSIQLAGFFHDAGHRAVFKSTFFNDLFGGFIAALANISYSYWKFKHNKHHASPNEVDEDPDIEIPFISFTHRKKMANPLEERLKPYQAYLYFPLGVFALVYFKFRSLVFFKGNRGTYLLLEIPIYLIGGVIWYIVPFFLVPLPHALVFLALSNLGVGFYLMNIFAPNHKGMPQIEKGAEFSFLEQQIITARNVKSNPLLDILYIGLNYQIEHHLFPNCPRNKLKLITPYVLEICKKYNLEYSEVSLVETNLIILGELNEVASSS
ncbi:MAG: acyl-CoA desaturase [Candidatus Woykebacteria bacterium]